MEQLGNHFDNNNRIARSCGVIAYNQDAGVVKYTAARNLNTPNFQKFKSQIYKGEKADVALLGDEATNLELKELAEKKWESVFLPWKGVKVQKLLKQQQKNLIAYSEEGDKVLNERLQRNRKEVLFNDPSTNWKPLKGMFTFNDNNQMETIEQCAIRECCEESGLQLEKERDLNVFIEVEDVTNQHLKDILFLVKLPVCEQLSCKRGADVPEWLSELPYPYFKNKVRTQGSPTLEEYLQSITNPASQEAGPSNTNEEEEAEVTQKCPIELLKIE